MARKITAREEILDICARATGRTWKQDAERIAALAEAMG
jgi:hypothetical protein